MNIWQQKNLKAIQQRLIWLHNKEDGVLIKQQSGEGSLAIIKAADNISLYFVVETDDPQKPLVSGVMSQINLKKPLYLHSIYQQAMLLSILFVKRPQQAYMMGFGGGRIPMVLQHYFRTITLHSSETDSDVLKMAEMFFAIKLNQRMQVAVQDGREHLSQSTTAYDIILIDCFTAEGVQPTQLATKEFYQLCQARLSPQGVVSTNLATTDPLFERKKLTFTDSFNYVYGFHYINNYVLFGSNSCDIDSTHIQQRTLEIMQKKKIEMPLNTIATAIKQLTTKDENDENIADILVDASISHY
ncbi:MAG TPA: spermine synthase [Thiothrix sp.]|nr:spermine synthase [Thiothrix sp.]